MEEGWRRMEKVTALLIRWCHQKTAHSGRNITLNEIRSSRFWVMQGSSAVKKMISRCWWTDYGRLTTWQIERRAPIYSLWCGHIWSISHQRKKKHIETIWSSFHVFGKSCHLYWNDQKYGHRLLYIGTQKIYW